MGKHVFPGIRPEPLASYLAGLGLIRVLGEGPDPQLTAWWDDAGLVLETAVDDIPTWLCKEYIPTPVLSPWNEGSGFGAKDKTPRDALEALLADPSPRLDPFREALKAARYVGEMLRGSAGWTKERAVQEFRNRCPEQLLPWLDAVVVLAGRKPYYPPLLGTGGNDGRLDFSTTFHQRLLELLPADRAEAALALAQDLLAGTQVHPLSRASAGQFDPGATGGSNSSPFGVADSMVNPWSYVLLIEGSLLFAATCVRRHQHGVGRAAIPFTVENLPDGSASGAERKTKTRGELWAPVWDTPFSLSEIRQLFSEARASWSGKPARRSVEFYAATRTLGVARGVSAFARYGLHQRNGRSYTAVPIERVQVISHPEVKLAAQLEEWVSRVRGGATAAVGQQVRAFDKAYHQFAKDGGPIALGQLLAAVTRIELAAGRSARTRDAVSPRRPPQAGRFLRWIRTAESPELRLAAGIASARARASSGSPSRSMRQILLPIEPGEGKPEWSDTPLVTGLGLRPVRHVLADVLVWRARSSGVEEPDQVPGRRILGVPTFRLGISVPDADLHVFATPGGLEEKLLEMWFLACLALDWSRVSHSWRDPGWPEQPVPLLGVLHPFAAGLVPAGGGPEASRLGMAPDWPARLAAGQLREVHVDASRRLRRAGLRVAEAPDSSAAEGVSGVDIAAALVPRCAQPNRVLRRYLACPFKPSDEPGPANEINLHEETEEEML